MPRQFLVVLAAILFAGPLRAQQSQNETVLHDTGFRPSVNGMASDNVRGPGRAWNGACDGNTTMAKLYWNSQLKSPGRPGLGDVTRGIAKEHGRHYMNQVGELLQQEARNGGFGGLGAGFSSDTDAEVRTDRILNALKKSGKSPVSLIVNECTKYGDDATHRIEVTGAVRNVKGEIEFTIYDPNVPAHHEYADQTRMCYDKSAGRWRLKTPAGNYWTLTNAGVLNDDFENRSKLWRVLDMAKRGVPIEDIRKQISKRRRKPTVEKKGKKWFSIDALKNKIGGVAFRFDPELLDGSVSEEELDELERRLQVFLKNSRDGVLHLELNPAHVQLWKVRVGDLASAATVGPLTRVRGYVLDEQGELYIVGTVEEGEKPISLDLLIVALRTVWRDGLSPFVSLDPDPEAYEKRVKVRIGGVPPELRETAFVCEMLEADYAMKKIGFGVLDHKIDGFECYADLVDRQLPRQSVISRHWLEPREMPVGGILETRRGTARAVLFENEVQVMTENMRNAGRAFLPVEEVDPICQEAADIFTSYYDDLAAAVPSLRHLRQVFDVCKLAAILRAHGISTQPLKEIAARTPARTEIPQHYPIVRRRLSRVTLSGGAVCLPQRQTWSIVTTDDLQPLIASTGREPVEVELPDTWRLDGAAAALCSTEFQITRAVNLVARWRFAEARERLDLALAIDPDHPVALALRAAANMGLGRIQDSARDIERAADLLPYLQGMRGMVRSRTRNIEGARTDVAESSAAFPEDETVAAWNAATCLCLVDLDGAQRHVDRLAATDPGHPNLAFLRGQLGFLKRLSPERARDRMRLITDLPPAINIRIMKAYAGIQTDPNVGALLREALRLAEVSDTPAVRELHIRERCLFLLALVEYLRPTGHDPARRLRELRPDWPSGYLAEALAGAARNEDPSTLLALFDRALQADPKGDAVLADFALVTGSDRSVASVGMLLWLKAAKQGGRGSEILDRVLPLMGDIPEAPFLSALKDPKRRELVHAVATLQVPDFSEDILEQFREVEPLVPAALGPDAAAVATVTSFYNVYVRLLAGERPGQGLSRVCSRYLMATGQSDIPQHARDSVEETRAVMWTLMASELLRGLSKRLEASGFNVRAAARSSQGLQAAIEDQDRAEACRSAKLTAEKLDEAGTLARKLMREDYDRIGAVAGALSGIMVEFAIALMQRQAEGMLGQMGLPEGASDLLSGAPELEALKMAAKNFTTYTETPIRELWESAVAKADRRIDQGSMLKLLELDVFKTMGVPEQDDLEATLRARAQDAGSNREKTGAAEASELRSGPTMLPFVVTGVVLLLALGTGVVALRRRLGRRKHAGGAAPD